MAPQTQHGAIGGASEPPAEGFGSFLIHKCLESQRKGLWEPLCQPGVALRGTLKEVWGRIQTHSSHRILRAQTERNSVS